MDLILGAESIKFPLTGIGRYALELANGLRRQPEVKSLHFLVGGAIQSDVLTKDLQAQEKARAEAAIAFRRNLMGFKPLLAAYRGLKEVRQAWALRPYRGAIYHGPNYYLPLHDGPSIATFHDLSIFKHPEFHPQARVQFMTNELPRALKRADLLLTDSNYTRDEVIAYSGFSAERVLAIPLAASGEFRPRSDVECSEIQLQLDLRYQSYTLYAGTIEPRKNLCALLDAYEGLAYELRHRVPLVVAGYRGWRSDDIHSRLLRAQSEGWARYLDYVAAEHLPVLFSGARAFAFPSIYEGFGLPVLEAMASGVPVVCSNATSLTEVAGNCALMCDPEDVLGLRQLIERAIEDDSWRQSAISNGLAHAASFSWAKTVRMTMEAYRLAASF